MCGRSKGFDVESLSAPREPAWEMPACESVDLPAGGKVPYPVNVSRRHRYYPVQRLAAISRALLLCLGSATLAQAQPAPPAATATTSDTVHDIRSIVASGVLRVGISRFDILPFHRRRANGAIEGKEAELAYQIARALAVKVSFVDDADTFDETIRLVADGRADIAVSMLTQNFAAAKSVRFSAPYMTLRHALLYNRTMVAQEANGGTIEDVFREFRGRVGIVGGSPFVAFSDQNFPMAVVTEFESWAEAVAALRNLDVDILYDNEFEVRRALKDDPALHVRYGAAVMKDKLAFLAVAVCDPCTKLQEFINYFFIQNEIAFSIDELLSLTLKD
jgi:polar amino acid transport system substrate-binding protein